MKFNDIRTYTIQIQGRVQEEDISRDLPRPFTIEHIAGTNTMLTILADQSGVIGLIRHLHAMGMLLLSVNCRNENLLNPGSGTKGDL